MKVRAAILLTMSALLFCGSFFTLTKAYAADRNIENTRSADRLLEQIENTMQTVYEAAMSNNKQAGYLGLDKLRQLSVQLAERNSKSKQSEAAAHWKTIAEASKGIMATSSNNVLSGRWYEQVSQLKLAVDVLVRPNEALWLQYDRLLVRDIQTMRQLLQAVNASDLYAVQAIMQSMEQKVERIALAVKMSNQQFAMPAVEERIRYTSRLMKEQPYAGKEVRQQLIESLVALEKTIGHLFPSSTTSTITFSQSNANNNIFVGWSLFIGGIITLILSLTIWRKYRIQPYGIKTM